MVRGCSNFIVLDEGRSGQPRFVVVQRPELLSEWCFPMPGMLMVCGLRWCDQKGRMVLL